MCRRPLASRSSERRDGWRAAIALGGSERFSITSPGCSGSARPRTTIGSGAATATVAAARGWICTICAQGLPTIVRSQIVAAVVVGAVLITRGSARQSIGSLRFWTGTMRAGMRSRQGWAQLEARTHNKMGEEAMRLTGADFKARLNKEVIKDPVYDHGDMIANTVGGAAAGVTLYLFKWEF